MKWLKLVAIAAAVAVMGLFAWRSYTVRAEPPGSDWHVVLVGASIGQGWKLDQLPQRVTVPGMSFEALQVWQFDKTSAIDDLLMRPRLRFRPTLGYIRNLLRPAPRVPNLVILKECSSYFPGDLPSQQALLRNWVERLQQRNIAVMVATAVPITRARAARDKPGKQAAIVAYNDWVHQYAAEQHLPLLDLEKATRADDKERLLRDDFDIGDGSHINASAYRMLDQAIIATLCGRYPQRCRSSGAHASS